VRVVDLLEVGERAPLAPEELHHRHAGDVLLQERVDARDAHTRTSRKLSRARALNQAVSATRNGRMAKVTSASRQLSQNSTPTMPSSSMMSPKIATRPAVKSSFSASTSVVTR
jgi:hypothetical protein